MNDVLNSQNQTKSNPMSEMFDEILTRDILDLIGAGDLPDDQKEELYKKMLETILNRVIYKLDSQLSDEDVEKLKEVTEKKDRESFFQLFKDKGIDINTMFQEEAALYKVEMIALTSQGGANG